MTLSNNAPMADLRDVLDALLAEFPHLTRDLLKSPARIRKIARPRQIGFALARELTRCSLPQIGRFFCRDHTTVLHGTRRIAALCAAGDLDLEISVNAVRRRVMDAIAPADGPAVGRRARIRRSVEAGETISNLEREAAA